MTQCEMKGFLTLLIMWIVSKKPMTGAEIALELEKRKGSRPSPGTIYPALKFLRNRKLLNVDENKRYTLSKKGEKELEAHIKSFFRTFCDLRQMRSCCK